MATQYSNKPIVTDGLVYALDFGNPKSYVSGSSIAKSLNFSNFSASINAGFDSRAITFTGSQTAVTNFAPVNLTNYESGSWTAMATIKLDSTGYFMPLRIGNDRFTTRIANQSLELNYNLSKYSYPKQYEVARLYNPTAFRNGSYANLTLRGSSGSLNLFVNGIPVSPTSAPVLEIAAVNGDLSLNGNAPFGVAPWSGSLATFHFYNRALTADEIYYNYQLVAPRYNLPTISKPYTVDEDVFLFVSRSGIVDPIITSSLDTFVRGLKTNRLWDKMFAIYPFVGTGSVGTNLTGSQRWNLKESGIYSLTYSGIWNGSVSGSTPSGSNTFIQAGGINPSNVYSNMSNTNTHMTFLSYDTPVSTSYVMGTGMTEELAVSTLAGDYGTPAAAYSVRKVRSLYTGSLMDVRRSYDNTTSSIGYNASGDLDTGSLLDWTIPGRSTLPGAYEGLAAAYSLRRVSSSYTGPAIQANNGLVYRDIGFDSNNNLNTGSLTSLVATGSNVLAGNYSGLAAAYSLRRVTSSYSGFAIEVQSGSVSQSIGFDSFGNLDTASLLTFAGSGNAFVKTWYDQSGNNRHATQSVAASQPQIVSLGTIITQSNRPTIQFDGSSDNLLIPIQLTTGFDIFKTVRYTNVGGYPMILSEAPGVGGALGIARDPSNKFGISRKNQATVTFTSTGSNNQVYVTNHYSTGVSSGNITVNFRLNGGSEETTSLSSVITGSTSVIGMGNNLDYFAGTTHEILIYSSSQASNRTYITNNINAYYNIYTTSSVSTENAFVNTWYDQSGNNRHATQTASIAQPLIVLSGSLVTKNGRPALRFDGVNDALEIGDLYNNQTSASAYAVISAVNNATLIKNSLWNIGTPDDTHLKYFNGTTYDGFSSTVRKSWTDSNDYSNQTLINVISTNNLYSFYGNSTLFFTTSSNTFATSSVNYLGRGVNPNEKWDGNIQEVILYNSTQTSNRPLIENNINNYYNIYTGSNHGFVARWYDQSGNNRHATQTATGSQPLIVLSGSLILTNGKPAPTWVSSSLTSSLQGISRLDMYVVQQANSTAYLYPHSSNPSSNYGMVVQSGSTSTNLSSYGATPTFFVNSNLFSGTTRGELFTAISSSQRIVVQQNTSTSGWANFYIAAFPGLEYSGSFQEMIFYSGDQSSNRGPIEYGINSYYNIYPQTSSFATSSFAIRVTSGSVSASLNNRLTSGVSTTGSLGIMTVSRTGSNSLTIALNRSTTSFTVPASGALSTGIYLGAINNNSIALGNSPLNISYASIGTGLTAAESRTYNYLVNNLQQNLGRNYLFNYVPNAIAAYSLRKLNPNYSGPVLKVRRSLDNTTQDIQFSANELDTNALLSFVGSGYGYVDTWYDQSGNNNHVTQTTLGSQPLIVITGSVYSFNNRPGVYFGAQNLSLGRSIGAITASSTYTVYAIPTVRDSTTTWWTGNSDTWWQQFSNGYTSLFSNSRRNGFPLGMSTNGQSLFATFHTGSLMQAFQNGISLGSNTTQPFSSGSNLILGGNGAQAGSTFGPIHELVIYPTQDSSSRSIVENNLNMYYQIY